MKSLILTFTFLFVIIGFGQQSPFMQNMQEALENYSQSKTVQDYINASYKFEQIASVETENWLPLYYHAMAYTMASYRVSKDNPARKDELLDIAYASISKIKLIAPTESEVFALEALFYTAKLNVNPMERGQKYSALSVASVQKALALNPNNIRAKQLQIANEFGVVQFFGSDTAPICEKAQSLVLIWDDYKIESPIHPNWGKAYLTTIANSCQPKPEKKIVIDSVNESNNSALLTISINQLTSNNGFVLLQIMDKNGTIIKSLKGDVENLQSTIQINDLEHGTYSIQYFHDENSNMKMDSDKYGRPTEGYGHSNNAKGFMGPPKYSKTLFEFNTDLTLSLKTRN